MGPTPSGARSPIADPPALSWDDLRDRRVAVWGLGMEGRSSIAALSRRGISPVLVDDNPARTGLDGVLPTQGEGLAAMRQCDVVVKSPGISRHSPEVADLVAAGVSVAGGLGLWLAGAPRDRVVMVTGTKGKSTTSAILGHLLVRLGVDVIVGGNVGNPPWTTEEPASAWVIEVSSYQATDLPVAPGIVVVTSLSPDHLTWHADDVATYYADKLSLCTRPGRHVTVANAADPVVTANAEFLGPDVTWVGDRGGDHGQTLDHQGGEWVEVLGVMGEHNRQNARLAAACLPHLGLQVDEPQLAEAARDFTPLESRLTPIGTVDGVLFIDDSLSTNVLPTLAAVAAMGDRPTALLVGGFDRGIDYDSLITGLAGRRAPTLVLTMPTNGVRIAEAFRQAQTPAQLSLVEALDLEDATRRGHAWAQPLAGVVLLSPAAASFDRFDDYRHRARVFTDVMRSLAAPT